MIQTHVKSMVKDDLFFEIMMMKFLPTETYGIGKNCEDLKVLHNMLSKCLGGRTILSLLSSEFQQEKQEMQIPKITAYFIE